MYKILHAPYPMTVPGGMPGPLGGSPGSGPDVNRIWMDTKAALFTANGAYEGKTSVVSGRAVPRISMAQAEQYWAFWKGVSQRLLLKLSKSGRPTWSLHGAFNNALARWGSWHLKYSSMASYRFVSFTAADELFTLLGRFVNEINAGVWTGYNTETDWENAMESLDWVGSHPIAALRKTGEAVSSAAGDAWDKIKEFNDRLAKELGDVWMIMKWGSAALIAAYAYQVATKEKRR